MRKRRKRLAPLAVAAIALAGTAAVLGAGVYAAGSAICDYVVKRRDYKGDWTETNYRRCAKVWNDWWYKQELLSREAVSFDGLKLRGKLLRAAKPTKKVAVVIHGHECTAGGMGFISEFYHRALGFDVLAPDLRAHGDSEGKYIAMGGKDSRDIISWIELLQREYGEGLEVVLHGISMGAATTMLACGRDDLPSCVKCAVSDCGYSVLREELEAGAKKISRHIPAKFAISLSNLPFKLRAKYDIDSVKPIDAVKRTAVPMLFIHGSKDSLVPVEMAYELFASHKGEKDILVVNGAEHAVSFFEDSEKYEKTVREFVGKYIV